MKTNKFFTTALSIVFFVALYFLSSKIDDPLGHVTTLKLCLAGLLVSLMLIWRKEKRRDEMTM